MTKDEQIEQRDKTITELRTKLTVTESNLLLAEKRNSDLQEQFNNILNLCEQQRSLLDGLAKPMEVVGE